jgi:hypothetical protein
MPEFLKSKLGILLVSVYLLLISYAVFEINSSPPKPMSGFGMLILTAPWSFWLALLFENLGIMTKENGDSFLYIYVAFGGLCNAAILYLIGCVFTKVLKFLSLIGKKN